VAARAILTHHGVEVVLTAILRASGIRTSLAFCLGDGHHHLSWEGCARVIVLFVAVAGIRTETGNETLGGV
jgi:hypothetical protein